MSGIDALNIAKDSLLSHQTAINLTGTNIANANTPGYSRQRAAFSTLIQSVEIAGIERIYDQFLGVQINEQANDLGDSEARKDALGRIEMTFNETDGGGINELLNKFWGAWENLSTNPSGQAERQALVSVSESLTSMFRSYSNELRSAQDDANTRIPALVNQVNGYASDIADINARILQAGTEDTDEPGLNSLRDKRAKLLSGLAEIVDFHYVKDSKDSISVFLSNGMPMVEGGQTWELGVKTETQTSFHNVVFKDDPDKKVINSSITKGKLAAFLEVRDVTIGGEEGYMASLDALAAALVKEVNAQHKKGYDMSQNLGEDFFIFDIDPEVKEAGYMKVSADIIADINKIAASETVNGDGGNAVSMNAIKNELTMNDTSTFSSYYSALVAQVGQDVAYVNRSFDHHTNLMSQLTNRREGISGVSIDEEMMNLIRYQTGYNASARLFGAAQELADTLLNLVK
ncbi:MAG: flagellar hook-associated protein 1 FlgK [Desulfobacteraceae bacterium Eth-SRB1]|nr:MAG: flagellar hook-associated protein 1 FlgK [Desulfobacteraceae bacterium Eth-SRB1]